MIAFNTDEISSSVTSEEIAGVDVVERVDLGIDSSFNDARKRDNLGRSRVRV
jgi:hypothetical protein